MNVVYKAVAGVADLRVEHKTNHSLVLCKRTLKVSRTPTRGNAICCNFFDWNILQRGIKIRCHFEKRNILAPSCIDVHTLTYNKNVYKVYISLHLLISTVFQQ